MAGGPKPGRAAGAARSRRCTADPRRPHPAHGRGAESRGRASRRLCRSRHGRPRPAGRRRAMPPNICCCRSEPSTHRVDGLEDRGGDGVEAIEPPANPHQMCSLRLKHLPDRLIGDLGMLVRLGVGDAAVEQQGVQLLVARHPQPRRKKALTHQADLVLDLARSNGLRGLRPRSILTPPRRRRARHRLDEIMTAHLQETTVELAVLADKHRLHRRLPYRVASGRRGSIAEPEPGALRPACRRCRACRFP